MCSHSDNCSNKTPIDLTPLGWVALFIAIALIGTSMASCVRDTDIEKEKTEQLRIQMQSQQQATQAKTAQR